MFDERIAIGLPSLAGYSLLGALSQAADLGFQSVMSLSDAPRAEHSLGAFPTLAFSGLSKEQKRETTDALAQFKHVAIHQAWDKEWQRWIDCAAWIGAEIVTVHSGLPADGQSSSAFLAQRSGQLQLIGDYAEDNGVRIGIENEGGTCEDYLELIASVSHPFVGGTLDLGHCAYFQSVCEVADPDNRACSLNETIHAMVRSLNEKLFSLHVHDVRQSDWRDHQRVGSGVIEFPALFMDLQHVRYTGLFEVELEEPERETAASKTGEYLTDLCQTILSNTSSAEQDAAADADKPRR